MRGGGLVRTAHGATGQLKHEVYRGGLWIYFCGRRKEYLKGEKTEKSIKNIGRVKNTRKGTKAPENSKKR